MEVSRVAALDLGSLHISSPTRPRAIVAGMTTSTIACRVHLLHIRPDYHMIFIYNSRPFNGSITLTSKAELLVPILTPSSQHGSTISCCLSGRVPLPRHGSPWWMLHQKLNSTYLTYPARDGLFSIRQQSDTHPTMSILRCLFVDWRESTMLCLMSPHWLPHSQALFFCS